MRATGGGDQMLLFLAAGDTRIEMSGWQLDVLESKDSAHSYRNLESLAHVALSSVMPCGFRHLSRRESSVQGDQEALPGQPGTSLVV